jgi:hypothetical protein
MSWYNSIPKDDKLSLPKIIEDDSNYFKILTTTLEYYSERLEQLNVDNDILMQVKEINSLITASIICYFQGDIQKAQNKIKRILEIPQKQKVIICNLNESFGLHGFIPFLNDNFSAISSNKLTFYKARVSDSIMDFRASDMLHIPFNKRSLVRTQRFSTPGLPCMYFGTSSYVCWLELEKPTKSQFHVSAFEMDSSFKILNLISSWEIISVLSQERKWDYRLDKNLIIKDLILLWPLVCATSFKVRYNNGRTFKSEYIISQLLMQIINNLSIDGICYYSKRVLSDKYAFPYCVNLALPAKYSGETKISDICSKIKVKNSVNFEEYTLLKDKYVLPKLGTVIGPTTFLAQFLGNYDNTIFSDFDNYLKEQPYMEFTVEDINRV